MKKGILLLFFASLIQFHVLGGIHLVINTNNAGAGSLRQAILNASQNDTVLINIKGTIYLQSTIQINKSIVIIGPYPKHLTISEAPLFSGQYLFHVVGTSNLYFNNVGFSNSNNSPAVTAIKNDINTKLYVEECIFKEFKNSALIVQSTSFVRKSSFFNNNNSRVIYSESYLEMVNCSFLNNNTNLAAIIETTSVLHVTHCTFYSNNTTADIAAMNNSSIHLTNNIFTSFLLNISGSPSWISLGGNVFLIGTPALAALGLSLLPNDISGTTLAQINFKVPREDGYGLVYVPVNSGSIAIDRGTVLPTILTDCRRAPRILYGNNTLSPDAGAVEYTPFVVVNSNPSGPGSLQAHLNNINTIITYNKFYIEFDIPSPVNPIYLNQSLDSVSGMNKSLIIDGYTQLGSAIWGPGATIVSTTPFILPIEIYGNIFLGYKGLNIEMSGASVFSCSGIKFNQFADYAINLNDIHKAYLYGNHFSDNEVGLLVKHNTQGDSVFVGLPLLYARNQFDLNDQAGILLKNTNPSFGLITNNFIGLNHTNAPMGNDIGIHVDSSKNILIGERIMGNIISGNAEGIVIENNCTGVQIINNKIGTGIWGNSSVPNNVGINVNSSSVLTIFGNIISGNINEGIFIENNSSGIVINNNIIGFDILNTPAGNGSDGIKIRSSNNIIIGDFPFNMQGENIIANNGRCGIYLETSSSFSNNIELRSNKIFNNNGLAFSLQDVYIPLINDVGDLDDGNNYKLNHPYGLTANHCVGMSSVNGLFDVAVPGTYKVDLYKVDPNHTDPSGHGECSEYVATATFLNLTQTGTQAFSFIVNDPVGTIYTLTLSYFDGNGYSTSEFSQNVTLLNYGNIPPTLNYSTCPNVPVAVQIPAVTGSYIVWNYDDDISDINSFQPTITTDSSKTYNYTLYYNNCTVTGTVYITVSNHPNCNSLVIYNAFSPNNDGMNDTWIINGANLYPNNKVTILNRWGDKLITFDNYDNVNVVWDGRVKGELLPAGTYYFIAEFFDVNQIARGWVQLTR